MAKKLSKYGVWCKIKDNYLDYMSFLSSKFVDIIQLLKLNDLKTQDKDEIMNAIKQLKHKQRINIRSILNDVLDYLTRNKYDTLGIENVFSTTPDTSDEAEAITDALIKINDALDIRYSFEKIIEVFATEEEKNLLKDVIITERKQKNIDFLKRKYKIYENIMLIVFYVLYIMFIIPLLMMLF